MTMRKLASLSVILAALALLLAACGTPLAPVSDLDEVQTPAAGSGLTTSALPDWSADDDLTVEILGTGLGNSNSAITNATLAIPDPENVVKVFVQVVTKAGSSGEGTYPDPESVSIVARDAGAIEIGTKAFTDNGVADDTADRVSIESQDGTSGTTGWSHEADFDGAVAEVEVTISNNAVAAFPNSPRALIVTVFRDLGDGTSSAGAVPNLYVFGNDGHPTGTRTLDLPADFAGGNVTVTLAISDLEQVRAPKFTGNDPRIIHYAASAGGVSEDDTVDKPNRGADLAIVELTLPNVPASATEVEVEVYSPHRDEETPHGDSVYFNTVSVTVEAEDGGTQGCTPGYWRQEHHFDSWTDYAPEDLFSDVFARVITVGAGGQDTIDNPTLLEAVWATGGGVSALARHAVAALLNAASPDVDYPYSVDEVIAMVQSAIDSGDFNATKDLFASANELGCPLN